MEKTRASPFERVTEDRTTQRLVVLCDQLKACPNSREQLECLYSDERVNAFLEKHFLDLSPLEDEHRVALLSLLALDQGVTLQIEKGSVADLKALAERLVDVERFYAFLGGLIGYHLFCMHLHAERGRSGARGVYHKPIPFEVDEQSPLTRRFCIEGLRHLDQLAEIYPIGGAADRLSTEVFQIAATRLFCGKSLLRRLIEDVQGREYLHEKCFGRAIRIPIVMMTSDEKGGTTEIRSHLESERWFGRDPSDFFFMSQPLVPAMSTDGRWATLGPCKPLFKPGGHGVIWKVARDCGAFEWLRNLGKTKALIRQINNPIAGVDDGLLTFTGCGFKRGKDFGFASCPRARDVSEGVDVVIETERGFSLTNIEYCDFDRYRVAPNADLPANTNILFVDLSTVEDLLRDNLVPGMLINAKKMKIAREDGTRDEGELIRLESTMQNLADGLIEKEAQTRSFITCNRRIKTISPLKREYQKGGSLSQTPEQCMRDMQTNARELLSRCGFRVEEDALFEYLPALGPLYPIIAQKLRLGHLHACSHLNLEIAEVEIEDLTLNGSLLIKALQLTPGPSEGRCQLRRVSIENLGIDLSKSGSLSCRERRYREQCVIEIRRGGEFCAENIALKGGMRIIVPENTKVTAVAKGEEIEWIQTKVEKPTWCWDYSVNSSNRILLKKI